MPRTTKCDIIGEYIIEDLPRLALLLSGLPWNLCIERCMTMEKRREFWFVVGSQFLYGPAVLETVAKRAAEMAEKLSSVLPYPLV